jgi:Protein of unknown function (DUF3224)
MTFSLHCEDLLLVCLLLLVSLPASAQTHTEAPAARKESVMMHASGTFDVKLTPQTSEGQDGALGRMSIDKQFHGDIEGSSKGEMLTGMTNVKGSAGYVAMEKVSATLKGKPGTFILQHTATMDRGTPQLSITVVPDSGTDELVGLTGKLTIKVADGKHSYDFEYSISETH